MHPEAAIVTTLRNPGPILGTFIRYHLAVGFKHLFLFFDDPGDPAMAEAAGLPGVHVIPNDEALQRRWRQTRLYTHNRSYHHFITAEVMARQVLNVEVAIDLARERSVDWLLHIDVDELFFPQGLTLPEHLAELEREGVPSVSYLNYEAVPEVVDVGDFFREVTLFKKHPRLLDENQWDVVRSRGRADPATGYFMGYRNGKSAGRVTGSLLPETVHHFRDQHPAHVRSNPVILHYINCGFSYYWNKYVTLGAFADQWFGEYNIAELVPLHLASRNVVGRGSPEAGRRFYQQEVMLSRPDIDCYAQAGILCRIEDPARLLAGIAPGASF